MKKVVVVGGGGHAKVVIDAIEEMILAGEGIEILGFLDDNEDNAEIYGYKRLGKISEAVKYRDNFFHLAIGNNGFRKRFFEENDNFKYLSVVHPSSIVSKRAKVETGCFVGAGAVINTDAKVGKLSIINTKTIIEHDCIVGEVSHISYGCIVGANSIVEEEAFLDMGSIVYRNSKYKNT